VRNRFANNGPRGSGSTPFLIGPADREPERPILRQFAERSRELANGENDAVLIVNREFMVHEIAWKELSHIN